jgi:hypothetical protein
VKVGDLVMAGINGDDDNILGIILEDCPPETHNNGMHLIHILHSGFMKWWPASYVRKVNESR